MESRFDARNAHRQADTSRSDRPLACATSSTLARSGWFDMAEIERVVAAHQSGRRDHGRLIWQFFMLEKSLVKLFGI